jgi:hypothetical protein
MGAAKKVVLLSRGPATGTIGYMSEHYQRPGWFTTNVFNRIVAVFTRFGLSVYGSRVLEVKGRTSGEWRQTPVNLMRYRDGEYLVAPRGQTQWVKNLRASGQGRLVLAGAWSNSVRSSSPTTRSPRCCGRT